MKKQSILLLLTLVAGAAIISFAQGTPGTKPAHAPEAVEMQNQINDLQARVRALESRLKGLESTVQELQRPHLQPLTSPGGNNSSWLNPPAFVPQPAASEPKPPKVWGEREINGWTFYIVPCGQQAHGSDEAQIGIQYMR